MIKATAYFLNSIKNEVLDSIYWAKLPRNEFTKNGFVIVENFLDPELCDELVQVGIQNTANDRIVINLSSLAAAASNVGLKTLFATSIASAGSLAGAQTNISTIDTALNGISTRRSRLGAMQNRLENALSEASNYSQNLSSSQSQILDVDYASESANMTRYQIQQQAGVAALAQAKAIPQSVISLLS